MMNKDIDPRQPRFRTIGRAPSVRLILQCSSCEKDLRSVKDDEVIDVTRAYYCQNCDTGTIIRNPAV